MKVSEINPGDIVALVGGGPPMTVERLEPVPPESDIEPRVACLWFDAAGTLHKSTFPAGLLEIVVERWPNDSRPVIRDRRK